MSEKLSNIRVSTITNNHEDDSGPIVETLETEPAEKTAVGIVVHAEKIPVTDGEASQGQKGDDLNITDYKADTEALWEELWQSDGQESDIADRNGERLYPIVMNLRDGHYGKMYNGGSPFIKLASETECPVGEKQLRRLFNRWASVLEIHQMGEQHPRLGVAHYSVAKIVKDPKQRLKVLRKAEAKRLNVSQTHAEAIKVSGRTDKAKGKTDPTIPQWRKDLQHIVGNTARAIPKIHKQMLDSGCSPNEDDLDLISQLKLAIEMFLATKVMEN